MAEIIKYHKAQMDYSENNHGVIASDHCFSCVSFLGERRPLNPDAECKDMIERVKGIGWCLLFRRIEDGKNISK